jgi:hypothetical protein
MDAPIRLAGGLPVRHTTRPAVLGIARIHEEIRRGGWPNASTLARLLEVNARTIHRDLDCLRDQLGAPHPL